MIKFVTKNELIRLIPWWISLLAVRYTPDIPKLEKNPDWFSANDWFLVYLIHQLSSFPVQFCSYKGEVRVSTDGVYIVEGGQEISITW